MGRGTHNNKPSTGFQSCLGRLLTQDLQRGPQDPGCASGPSCTCWSNSHLEAQPPTSSLSFIHSFIHQGLCEDLLCPAAVKDVGIQRSTQKAAYSMVVKAEETKIAIMLHYFVLCCIILCQSMLYCIPLFIRQMLCRCSSKHQGCHSEQNTVLNVMDLLF